jgi:hypothetical protein
MHGVMKRCNGEPVWRIEAGLCREKRPGTNAGIRDSRREGSEKSKQQE